MTPRSSAAASSVTRSVSRSSRSPHIVRFEKGDPDNPMNWPEWKKWMVFFAILPVNLSLSWGGTAFSPATKLFEKAVGVSEVVATLGISLYVLGLAIGPLFLAPLAEYYGRTPIYYASYPVYFCFLVGTALAPNLGAFLSIRFISGLAASSAITNLGGTIADMWPVYEVGIPMSIFIWSDTVGAPSGYLIGSFVTLTGEWQNIFWALLGITGGFYIFMCCLLRETRHSIILQRRANRERKEREEITEELNPNVDVPDEDKREDVEELLSQSLVRPFRFLTTEAIVVFTAAYNGFVYGLSYLFTDAFPLVFGEGGHGFGTVGQGLSFVGIIIGVSIGVLTNLYQERYYQRRIRSRSPSGRTTISNIPEARVYLSRYACLAQPLALFWFAWTSYKTVHWIVPMLASVVWGWSYYVVILFTYTYVEDTYKEYSASALAGLAFVSDMFGAGFPLFGTQMYNKLGYEWATSLIAFLSCLMIPTPFLLFYKGHRLRERSPWANEHMGDKIVLDDDGEEVTDSEDRESEGAEDGEVTEKGSDVEVATGSMFVGVGTDGGRSEWSRR
ncbi:MFS multidrug transporter-like protein [Saitoella complicata NRRL Y-17804]|nr:MFS multidrug transporter-like protein [Saitoella complicata NRRL Y-17804]ODQ54936.1 MFS multidrug transporter-like protein [Saitoella complicata NRRL Y-17804]